jgi:hypothetical protein
VIQTECDFCNYYLSEGDCISLVELLEDVLFAQHADHIFQGFPELITSVYRTQKATVSNDTNPDDEALFGGRINKEALSIMSTLFELSEKTE